MPGYDGSLILLDFGEVKMGAFHALNLI